MHTIGDWGSLPLDIQELIFSQIDLKNHLYLRAVSETWKKIFDSREEYWQKECAARFGDAKKIYQRVKGMQEYQSLFASGGLSHFKIFCTLHDLFSKFREHPPLTSEKKYGGYVKNLVSRENPHTGEVDLYFLDEANILRVLRQGEYLSGPLLEKASFIAELPKESEFNCFCPAGSGMLTGTEAGMIYYLNLEGAEHYVHRLLEEPLKGPVVSVSVSKGENLFYAVVMFKEMQMGDMLRSWVFRIDLSGYQKTAERIVTAAHLVKPNPGFLDDSRLLYAKQSGGAFIMDLKTGKIKDVVILDPENPDREPEILCLCVLKDKVVLNTAEGRFGSIAIDELNNGLAAVSWKNLFRGPLLCYGMRPIGASGFCAYTEKGNYWALPNWKGEWVWNWSGKTGMKNIRWLENGHAVYLYGEGREAGIYVLNYTTRALELISSKVRHLWQEFLMLRN